MKFFALIVALVAVAGVSGCYLAAIPRYKEIQRPVTTAEVTGRWVITPESQRSLAVDGVTKKPGEEFAIVLHADGSCSYRTILDRAYVEKNGHWSVRHDPSRSFKNRLDFRFGDVVVLRMMVALDSAGMVLWESWGDPDEGIDLVYRREEGANKNGAANRSQPGASAWSQTSEAAGSGR